MKFLPIMSITHPFIIPAELPTSASSFPRVVCFNPEIFATPFSLLTFKSVISSALVYIIFILQINITFFSHICLLFQFSFDILEIFLYINGNITIVNQ